MTNQTLIMPWRVMDIAVPAKAAQLILLEETGKDANLVCCLR